MELAVRKGTDRFIPAGGYRALESRLRDRQADWAEVPTAVLSCFDRSTRLLPFVLYDRFIFPAGARSIAGALGAAGFRNTRAIFQLWNPRFRPSQARLGNRPLEMLMISSMQMHSKRAYEAIRDAWTMGADRPLIIAGGPKAIYEPYHYWPIPGKDGPVAPDVVVTGEQYILLDLLNTISAFHRRGDTMRAAFERARMAGALDQVPGLVYLAPEANVREPVLVDTGLQRLVQCLDEMPDEEVGLSMLEPPHRGRSLSAKPVAANRLRWLGGIISLVMTQGCKFNCSYCPIPALNQKSWRFRSPENIAHQVRSLYERFKVQHVFGTDDNFFNHRQTAEEILEALARDRQGRKVHLYTEATQFDTYKNKDLLPVARKAGVRGLWFGIEDLTAELINKGQKPEVTTDLFRLLHSHGIMPMAMIMFHEGQPYESPGSLYGLANQVEFLRQAGAISIQVTIHTPAPGTREYEKTYDTGRVVQSLGDYKIPEAKIDGNHVTVLGATKPWLKQLQLLGGYASFYSLRNLFRALRYDGSPLRSNRIIYQLVGLWATFMTALRTLPYLVRLMVAKPRCFSQRPVMTTVPVRYSAKAHPHWPDDNGFIANPSPDNCQSKQPARELTKKVA